MNKPTHFNRRPDAEPPAGLTRRNGELRVAGYGPVERLALTTHQELADELFDKATAALAVCEACGFVWIFAEPDVLDSCENFCPRCGVFGAGPLYRCP